MNEKHKRQAQQTYRRYAEKTGVQAELKRRLASKELAKMNVRTPVKRKPRAKKKEGKGMKEILILIMKIIKSALMRILGIFVLIISLIALAIEKITLAIEKIK